MMTPTIPVALFDRLLVEGISPHELVRRKLMCLFNSCAVPGGDAPRDKCAYFREINGIAAAFQYLQKNYIPTALSSL